MIEAANKWPGILSLVELNADHVLGDEEKCRKTLINKVTFELFILAEI